MPAAHAVARRRSPSSSSRAKPAGYTAVSVLVVAAAFHVYWALGGTWGAAVAVGSRDLPPAAAVWVIVVLLAGAIAVLLGRLGAWGARLPQWIFRVGTWILVAVFLLAGLANVAAGLNEDTFGRAWQLLLFAPLMFTLAALCALVARSSDRGAPG